MAIAFTAAGSLVETVTTTLALVGPACVSQDFLVAAIVSGNNTAVVAPQGWNLILDVVNTAAMRTYVGWKLAGDDDTAATFNFTVAGTTNSAGVIAGWRGVSPSGNPVGGSSTSPNASSDTVTYATLTPRKVGNTVIAVGAYNLAVTTAGAMSGTDPTFTNRVDLEGAAAASIFMYDGPSLTGIATGSRTHSTTSTVDAINHGILFDLDPAAGASGGGAIPPGGTYARLDRVKRSRRL